MSVDDFFIHSLLGLGFKLNKSENEARQLSFLLVKEYRVLSNDGHHPLKFLNKHLNITITINVDGSFNVDYAYRVSNIYAVYDYYNQRIDFQTFRYVTINDVQKKEQITELLDTIKLDIKELNVIKLEEFSWR